MTKKRARLGALKSTLKWVGGKKRIAQEIVSVFPEEFENYFEPFLGGASVFLEANPKKAFLSDLNGSLINYYQALKTHPEQLMREARHLENTFNSLSNLARKKELFYKIRADFNKESHAPGVLNAARFLFLNKTAFNGLYRENSRGEFNVPFNNKENLVLIEEEVFFANHEAFQQVKLAQSSFVSAVDKVGSGDLVYFDPPYVPLSSTSAFTDYTKSSFGPEAQLKLRDLAKELVAKGATVVLSNSFTKEVQELYKDFELREITIRRLVAASSSSRGSVSEYLIIGRPNA